MERSSFLNPNSLMWVSFTCKRELPTNWILWLLEFIICDFWNNIPNSFHFLLRHPYSLHEIPSLYIRKIWNIYACIFIKLGFGEEGFYHFSLGEMGFCWVNDFLNCGMYFFELLVLISEGHWHEREFVGWT